MSKIGETFILIQVGNLLFFNKKWEIRWGKSGVGSEWVGGLRKMKWEVATTFPPDPGAKLCLKNSQIEREAVDFSPSRPQIGQKR